jgi:hypothetical protein
LAEGERHRQMYPNLFEIVIPGVDGPGFHSVGGQRKSMGLPLKEVQKRLERLERQHKSRCKLLVELWEFFLQPSKERALNIDIGVLVQSQQ